MIAAATAQHSDSDPSDTVTRDSPEEIAADLRTISGAIYNAGVTSGTLWQQSDFVNEIWTKRDEWLGKWAAKEGSYPWSKFLYRRARFHVIDLMRQRHVYRDCNYRSRRGTTHVVGGSMNKMVKQGKGEVELGELLQGEQHVSQQVVEAQELIEHLTKQPRQRRMLYLRFVVGLTMKEIGAELGISESRVSQQLAALLEYARHKEGIKS